MRVKDAAADTIKNPEQLESKASLFLVTIMKGMAEKLPAEVQTLSTGVNEKEMALFRAAVRDSDSRWRAYVQRVNAILGEGTLPSDFFRQALVKDIPDVAGVMGWFANEEDVTEND